ncbi:hypothetical protein [Ruegeria arenilitoris]|uniref:hypothetical protein n=1 Tax=Ruegeria arenilitoris TaxID=1173585 RepID=UPI00147C9FB1|nr:hypothetical protein [Ruegeria arenilitoris]
MSSKKTNAPGFNSLMASLGGKPEVPSLGKPQITPERKTAMKFGIDPDCDSAGREKKSAQKDERSERRTDIERRLGISLGDKSAPQKGASNIARAFGGTKSR